MASIYPGNITNVHGIRVGQQQNEKAKTGVTVVMAPKDGAIGGVSVRGAAPGTRETDLLRPGNLVEYVHAVVLAGGSAFGLAAADGVMRYLAQTGVGLSMGGALVPIVPSAVLFDLMQGEPNIYPDAAMGRTAAMMAAKGMEQGLVGAGCGATVGKLVPRAMPAPGGTGTASLTLACGVTVGAIACVNAVGDVYDPHSGKPLACGHLSDGAPVLCESLLYGAQPMAELLKIPKPTNTTLVVVATDAVLGKPMVNRLATCAHDGFARAIRPVHTQMDGDTAFALATGRVDADVNPVQLCAAAAEVVARAIANAVLCGGGR